MCNIFSCPPRSHAVNTKCNLIYTLGRQQDTSGWSKAWTQRSQDLLPIFGSEHQYLTWKSTEGQGRVDVNHLNQRLKAADWDTPLSLSPGEHKQTETVSTKGLEQEMLKGKCLSVTFDFKDSWLLKQCFCLSYHPLRFDKRLEPFLFTLRCSKMCVQSAAKKVFFQMILGLPTGKRRHETVAEPDGLAFSAFGYEWDTAHSELSGMRGASLHLHHHHSSLKSL